MNDTEIQRSMAPGWSWVALLLAGCMLVAMVFVGLTFIGLLRDTSNERDWIAQVTRIQVDSQKLSKFAGEAALGNLAAIPEMSDTHARMLRDVSSLHEGSEQFDTPPLPMSVASELFETNAAWERMGAAAQEIIEREALIIELAAAAREFLKITPTLQAGTDQAVRQLIESGAPNQQVFAASRELVLADRMVRRVNEVLQNGANSAAALEELGNEIDQFGQVHYALTHGNPRLGVTPVMNQQALTTLNQIARQFERARLQLAVILSNSQALFQVREAADTALLESQVLFDAAGKLSQAIADLPGARKWPSLQAGMLGLVVMIGLAVLLVAMLLASARRRADDAQVTNRRNQKAIMRLLDELSSLAEGDLTVRATVTDQITGAIADAFNYAIERLRELVTGINHTALLVADSAQSTRHLTQKLASAANEQAGQVDRVAGQVKQISGAFTGVAQRSKQSSENALESVSIAHNGAKRVRDTIRGMDLIRDQIQETAKRIKRLGESTQEIGDIVSLINDIAEQTNVLALNAAIQAASAGTGGRGFAVVADEVQQLAESATDATRRISSLVQTIQADTAEAVRSMEATTTEVVNGARTAQDAGKALVQIETASQELSLLIEEIARDAQDQSDQAARIAGLMDGIRQVSVATSDGSNETADAVSELADLVLRLRESVADFKLPDAPQTVPVDVD